MHGTRRWLFESASKMSSDSSSMSFVQPFKHWSLAAPVELFLFLVPSVGGNRPGSALRRVELDNVVEEAFDFVKKKSVSSFHQVPAVPGVHGKTNVQALAKADARCSARARPKFLHVPLDDATLDCTPASMDTKKELHILRRDDVMLRDSVEFFWDVSHLLPEMCKSRNEVVCSVLGAAPVLKHALSKSHLDDLIVRR